MVSLSVDLSLEGSVLGGMNPQLDSPELPAPAYWDTFLEDRARLCTVWTGPPLVYSLRRQPSAAPKRVVQPQLAFALPRVRVAVTRVRDGLLALHNAQTCAPASPTQTSAPAAAEGSSNVTAPSPRLLPELCVWERTAVAVWGVESFVTRFSVQVRATLANVRYMNDPTMRICLFYLLFLILLCLIPS